MNGLGSHCYSSRSGSSRDEVPRRSLVGRGGIPLLVSLFVAIRRHYEYVAERLSIQGLPPQLCSQT